MAKKYRVVDDSYQLGCKVETKDSWLAAWQAVTEYKSYDKPRKAKSYGGFWGNIVTEVTEEGCSITRYFPTVEKAKKWIREDKKWRREARANRRVKKVVHKE